MGKPTGPAKEQRRARDRLSVVPGIEGFHLLYPAGLTRRRWARIKRFFVEEAPRVLAAWGGLGE